MTVVQTDQVQGGYRAVANATARDAIPANQRASGMLVKVLDTGTLFMLAPNLTSWTQFIADSVDSSTWPMRVPFVLANPPAQTAGVANAGSVISGSVLYVPWEPGAFLYLGGPTQRIAGYPDMEGLKLGAYPQITSPSPTAVEFTFTTVDTTGRFEIKMKGGGQGYRVLIRMEDGSWGAFTDGPFRQLPTDGNFYWELVTLGGPGDYTVRIEFSNVAPTFYGIVAGPTDNIRATPRRKRRYIIAGDSFSEPTIVDTGNLNPWAGFPQRLAYLTGYDVWSAGSGGTGYVATNPGLGRPQLSARLANDVLAFDATVVFAMGVNDTGTSLSTFTTEVNLCHSMAAAAGKEIITLGPFCASGYARVSNTTYQYEDIIKTAAATYGAQFIPLLDTGIPDFLAPNSSWSSTLQTAITAGDTSLIVYTIPPHFLIPNMALTNWYVRIGSGASQEVAMVTNIVASGSYWRLVTQYQLRYAAAAGSPVILGGPSFLTGTGHNTAPANDGISDICVSSDGIHPTLPGHAHIARYLAKRLGTIYSTNRGSINYGP